MVRPLVAPFTKCKAPRFNPFKDRVAKKQMAAALKVRIAEANSRGRKHHKQRMSERQKRAQESRGKAPAVKRKQPVQLSDGVPKRQRSVQPPQLSAQQEAVRQAAAATAASASAAAEATTAAWASQKTLTQQLAQQARVSAAEAAQNAARLEAEACAEQAGLRAACQEYARLKRTIALCLEVFRAKRGRDPRDMREITEPHRRAWKRRIELRREFPGRPWEAYAEQGSVGAEAPSNLPSVIAYQPSAAACMSAGF